jgi:Arc/MetJ family transcription regulator
MLAMFKKVEIEVDDELVQEVIRRYHVLDTQGAVHLALRSLLGLAGEGRTGNLDEEFDEFSDPNAWVRPPRGD